ncbi:sarcosine oxidase delta subunit [Cytobacillus kochii]|uniref:Uncharacterized protein n=1 Tax=Cytobacillus kochii TaxID=859143 RepID=A0A248TDC8_9BACI|nr:hypothetical protein CKF48_01510 [Cytobacillus kochii]MDQ0185007.1 sarcosine oxidase delta subunit [Cytobacillus kochii]
MVPEVICPNCDRRAKMDKTLTAQSNQNLIFHCPYCQYRSRNIHTSKG